MKPEHQDVDQFIIIPWHTEESVENVIECEEMVSCWPYERENSIVEFLKNNVGSELVRVVDNAQEYRVNRLSLIPSDVDCTIVCTRHFGEPMKSKIVFRIGAEEGLLI